MQDIHDDQIDTACIQETWLPSDASKLPTMKGFNIYSNPRCGRRGGGVAVSYTHLDVYKRQLQDRPM